MLLQHKCVQRRRAGRGGQWLNAADSLRSGAPGLWAGYAALRVQRRVQAVYNRPSAASAEGAPGMENVREPQLRSGHGANDVDPPKNCDKVLTRDASG